jgi:hypothetical protein
LIKVGCYEVWDYGKSGDVSTTDYAESQPVDLGPYARGGLNPALMRRTWFGPKGDVAPLVHEACYEYIIH